MSAAPATPAAAAAAPAGVRARHALLLAGFTITLFLNAALLFAVQPMFSKMALPLLGGSSSVWNTCMLTFQALLLGGYLYAHLTTRWLGTRRQAVLHAVLLLLSLLALPVGIPDGWAPPGGAAPIPWLIALLLVGLGLPFILLSTGAPLLQQWFSRTGHPAAANPYFLYAASNAGSMLALLSYPFVVEPLLGLSMQSRLWSMAYAGVVILVALCGLVAARGAEKGGGPRTDVPVATLVDDDAREDEAADDALSSGALWRQRAWWTLLAFAPSSLLLGVTTYVTTDMAAVPLLWVVPLALYLLTFVIVFARRPLVPHALALRLHPLILLPLAAVLFPGRALDLRTMAPLHLGVFFITALVCHGELARLRPSTSRLTEFYLWLSVGGVLGGAFNVLLAPVIFDRVLEYQIVLAAACALRPWDEERDRGWPALRRDALFPLAVFAAAVAAVRLPDTWHPLAAIYGPQLLGALAAVACVFFLRRPLRFALGVFAVFMASLVAFVPDYATLLRERSFFGVYGVRDLGNQYHVLYHGTTLHGAQNLRPDLRRQPLTYYRLLGPLGDIFSVMRLGGEPLRVGVVGLGAGSVACYALPGDSWTFYEIDPLIERIARDRRYFTYLTDCTPAARVILGDARLSLASPDTTRYDLLVLDAFTSDAIPVHLMTREALAVYFDRLADDGVLALHISNRYLDLRPVVANLAADANLVAMLGRETAVPAEVRNKMHTASSWIAVARTAQPLTALTAKERWQPLPPSDQVGLWTDDYTNVLGVLIR